MIQKWVCRANLSVVLKNMASLSALQVFFGKNSSKLPDLFPFPYSYGSSTSFSDRLHDFYVNIPGCQ